MPEVKQAHPLFVGEISGIDTWKPLSDADTAYVQAQMDRFAVVFFRGQDALDDDSQLAFSARFGRLHRSITADRGDLERRLKRDELSDISNVGRDGELLSPDDARRIQQRANLLWHTDNSFREPAGLYTLLAARLVPPADGQTEFADTRAAFDALSPAMKERVRNLQVEHNLEHSRVMAGTGGVFDEVEAARFPSTVQPLVRRQERTGREALYMGSHAAKIVGWSYEDSQALLGELLAFATQPQFVYRHTWAVGDLVMWDNRVSLHRALPFDEVNHRRDLRRTSLMLEAAAPVAAGA